MTTASICIGAIVLIAVILIAYFAWRRWKAARAKSGFSYATPATPRVREAVGNLFASLRRLEALGREFEAQAAALPDATPFAGARLSANQLVAAISRTEKGLSGAPPTYANYLAVYRGLTSTDAALLDAADAYSDAGYRAHQTIALSALGVPPPVPAPGDAALAGIGAQLLAMGRQVRQVVASVHRLGVALDVE